VTRYTADSRDRVLDAVDMVSLVSTRTDLTRRGVDSYFGLCPFHDERTPSFHVRPDAKHYFCFGCQASGDPFTFVMETEGLDFKGALEALADRFGVALETEDEDPAAATRRQRRERLYSLLGRAATYYARYLWEAREAERARAYLLGRGLTEATLREFRVGYAPSAWDRMLKGSRGAGYSEAELLDAGLVQRSRIREGAVYDRFRERIMFPSVDARGRVRGFGARAMRDNQQPKYLNTSDSDVYHKREQLFGIDLARAPGARAGRMILVEGYTDVLALHQAGVRNAVGIMGTALTEEQVRELGRIVTVLELCLDADRAGQDAMLRAERLARGSELELRVVPLPDNTDPAELVEREGGDALRARVESSMPFVVFHVDRILDRADISSAEGRDRAALELGPVLELPASALREDLRQRVASRLQLSPGQLAALIAQGKKAANGTAPVADDTRPVKTINPAVRTERAFLVLCVALPEAGRRALAAIDPEQHLTSTWLRRVARHLAGQIEMPLNGLPADDEELAKSVADLVARAGRAGRVTEDHIEQQRLLLELARLDRAIRQARGEGGGEIHVLAHERETVLEAIRQIDARLERAV
jgi:DNA primase